MRRIAPRAAATVVDGESFRSVEAALFEDFQISYMGMCRMTRFYSIGGDGGERQRKFVGSRFLWQ